MKKYKKALVLMTALLPTVGHRDLIRYASCLADRVEVLLSYRIFEPIGLSIRMKSFQEEFKNDHNVIFYVHSDDNAPQNPEDSNVFWDYWKDTILSNTCLIPNIEKSVVVASEPYGKNVADSLNCDFMPYDLYRDINKVKSTKVRQNIVENFDQILPYARQQLKTTVTIFGAESCWKTTITKSLSKSCNGYFLFEWARPYLESLNNPDVTEKLMEDIHMGQKALQDHGYEYLNDKPFIFQDTDLLSTIGYYQIMGMSVPDEIIKNFKETESEIYFVMSDNVPFVPDPLRYGGNVRESTTQFWIDLLEKYDCNYYLVDSESFEEKENQIKKKLKEYTDLKFKSIKEFIRE